ncbi:helix-turn-helix transcriptional regulator [Streptomyces lydicus]|uniref:helix-turn-helix transcriptional regulator n=1 Tax=Streptomyces lydicus TaxID=47763 RepID=UPI0036E35707
MTSISNSCGALPKLFGRDDELNCLDGLIASAGSGRGVSVLIEGETGIGKTALLGAVAQRCEGAGFRVLRGASEELEQRIPFQVVRGCLNAATGPAHEVDSCRWLHRGISTRDREFGVAEGIQHLLADHCDDGPVALLLDDLQWADASSLSVLHRIHRGAIGQLPLLMCMTVQTTRPASGPAGSLHGIEGAVTRRLALRPLAEDDVVAMTADLIGASPGPALKERISAAAGNPLFVTEFVGALAMQGDLRIADGVADLSGAPGERASLPVSVNETILRQVDLLAHQTRDVVEVSAVMGPRVHLADLATVLGTPVMKVWQLVREAVDMGLLIEAGDRLTFRHNLVRQALLETMPRSVRIALLQQAGQALATADAPPEQVAKYLLMADVSLGAQALDWLARAAHTLTARAPADAVDLLERALTEVHCEDPRFETFSLELIRVLLHNRRGAGRAEQVARAAQATVGEPATQLTLSRLLAWSVFRQGDYERALAEATKALESSPADARLHAFVSQCQFVLGRLPEAERAAQRAVSAGGNGASHVTVYGLTALALLRLCEMRSREALELSDQAVQLLGRRTIENDLPMAPHFTRGLALMDIDRCAEAENAFAQGLSDCEDGAGTFLTAFHLGRARLFFTLGRWDDALAEVGAGLEAVDHLRLEAALHHQAALIAVHRGNLEDAVSRGAYQVDSHGCARMHAYTQHWTQAMIKEAQGDSEAALVMLFDAWENGVTESGPRALHHLGPDAARLAAETGDVRRLQKLCQALADYGGNDGTANSRAIDLLGTGLLQQDAEMLLESAESFGASGRRLYEAYARERAAIALAEVERMDEARKALNAALASYDQLGAVWDARRAERQLAGAGLRLRRRARSGPLTGWDALTETENVVVKHVAAGCSNPEIASRLFLSPRTVQFHLASIFTKLGIGSRVELAVSASRRAGPRAPGVGEPAIAS